ncbi:hypothetical protein [Pseudomonas sp. GM30]|uniref:hypothetical protein n=1 Tax=Pseudomonas sp. GM30 TaxID=1144328 RepID=UPI00135F1B1B|nr:hypothetical protein [Pseudomonas sp. GM30]
MNAQDYQYPDGMHLDFVPGSPALKNNTLNYAVKFRSRHFLNELRPVGAAEGCDLLMVLLKNKIKRSQPSAAPTGGR